MADERDESISGLVSGVLNDARELFRQEAALVRAEVKQEIANARSAAIKLGVALGALVLAGLFILTALAQAVADVFNLDIWAGFGIVGLLLAIVGLIAFLLARSNLRKAGPIPERTVKTMKENAEWLKRQTS